jgi:hypothetical protein
MFRNRARFAVVLSTLVLACTASAAPALARPVAQPTVNPGQAAAGWLARQMTDASHFTETFDGVTYPDQGLTIDSIFAFAATGTADNYGARAIAWLARGHILRNYIGNGTTSAYAGATANLLLAAEVRGVDPDTFGGVNLPARLASLLTSSGRYSDHSKYGDFSNVFSQSLAIIALTRLGGAPADAVSFLTGSECANGGFPIYFDETKCASDPDATGMAVQALLAAGQSGPAGQGLKWLAKVQQPDGGFSVKPSALPNSNSTGLAGEAFAAAGWSHNAMLAQSFLQSVQVGCSGKRFQQGAIAYNSLGFRRGTAAFATAQGILGLADVGLVQLTASGSYPGAPRLACSS